MISTRVDSLQGKWQGLLHATEAARTTLAEQAGLAGLMAHIRQAQYMVSETHAAVALGQSATNVEAAKASLQRLANLRIAVESCEFQVAECTRIAERLREVRCGRCADGR